MTRLPPSAPLAPLEGDTTRDAWHAFLKRMLPCVAASLLLHWAVSHASDPESHRPPPSAPLRVSVGVVDAPSALVTAPPVPRVSPPLPALPAEIRAPVLVPLGAPNAKPAPKAALAKSPAPRSPGTASAPKAPTTSTPPGPALPTAPGGTSPIRELAGVGFGSSSEAPSGTPGDSAPGPGATGPRTATGKAPGTTHGTATEEGAGDPNGAPVSAATVSRMPSMIGTCRGAYTDDARQQHIEGVVVLRLDIDAAGTARNIAVVQGLGHGLDEAAVAAIRRCAFHPGLRADVPVAVHLAAFKVRFVLDP